MRTGLFTLAGMVGVMGSFLWEAVQPKQPSNQPVASEVQDLDCSKASQFLRIRRDEKGQPVALETAIVRYVPMDCSQTSPTVDLVAAVHVGEKSYYQQLNREFQHYDAVLYELVAPEGTRVPKGGGRPSGHPVSFLQITLSNMLNLTHQLQEIDYTAKHFVHADMSPEQLSKAMKDRGEALWKMMLRVMGYSLAKQTGAEGPAPEIEILLALFDKNRAFALKRAMALQFEDMEGMTRAMDGPEGSSLIAGRNQAALAVLRRQLAEGKKKLAIFYGAAHMPDMERRLKEDFGLVPIQTRWLVAWDLRSPESIKPTAKKPSAKTRSNILQN
ncbi:MAG: hypothetical protein NZ602_07785 [Thermoguttaceae bacterium]|nr:hypothetical protein [Thermoguttaceae bacterium]MDW8039577.1 hypothetical protein [Thermoguttaceae bacterium]